MLRTFVSLWASSEAKRSFRRGTVGGSSEWQAGLNPSAPASGSRLPTRQPEVCLCH